MADAFLALLHPEEELHLRVEGAVECGVERLVGISVFCLLEEVGQHLEGWIEAIEADYHVPFAGRGGEHPGDFIGGEC